jgi:lipoprotein signal peptidase
MHTVLRAAPLAVACIGIDQLAKLLIRTDLPVCRQQPIVDCARLRIGPLTLVNALAAPPLSWSRPNSPPWIGVHSTSSGYILVRDPVAAVGLALLGCMLIVIYAMWVRRASWAVALGVGLQAGGALSNLLDRLLHTGVTDYVNVSPTLTFNLADVFLFVGMVLAMAGIAAGLLRSPSDFGPEGRQATHQRPGQAA